MWRIDFVSSIQSLYRFNTFVLEEKIYPAQGTGEAQLLSFFISFLHTKWWDFFTIKSPPSKTSFSIENSEPYETKKSFRFYQSNFFMQLTYFFLISFDKNYFVVALSQNMNTRKKIFVWFSVKCLSPSIAKSFIRTIQFQ